MDYKGSSSASGAAAEQIFLLTVIVVNCLINCCFPVYLYLLTEINYVLDVTRPGNELIIKDGPTCLSRSVFLTLGLQRDMDAVVLNN